jgi:hypothetical protein
MSLKFDNKIVNISSTEYNDLKKSVSEDDRILLAELDGRFIKTLGDYLHEIETKFDFPESCDENLNIYFDWIRDLDWLAKDGYTLIINNYKDFLQTSPTTKQMIIDDFREIILPWWQSEVEKHSGAKAKPFMVYLVD